MAKSFDWKSYSAELLSRATPVAAGLVITAAARLGIKINNPEDVAAVTAGVSVVWYGVFSILETRGQAVWSWLLGRKKPANPTTGVLGSPQSTN
jgi:hypothetical protein